MEGKELSQENITILQGTETEDSFGDRRNASKGQIRKTLKANIGMARRKGRELVFMEDILHAAQKTKYTGGTHIFFCLCSFLFLEHEIIINNGFFQSQYGLVWTIHYTTLFLYTFPLCFLSTIFQFTPEEAEHPRSHLMACGQQVAEPGFESRSIPSETCEISATLCFCPQFMTACGWNKEGGDSLKETRMSEKIKLGSMMTGSGWHACGL